MPVPAHFRVTALGRLGTGGERFSYGINLRGGAGVSTEPLSQAVKWGSIAAALKTMHTSPNTYVDPSAVLETVKVAHIGADGHYTADALEIAITGGAGQGVTVQRSYPQLALAVTLDTDRRGPSGRGRFYLPMPCINTDATNGWQLITPHVTNVRDAVATFLSVCNDQPAGDLDLHVVVASTKGYLTDVKTVRVGRLMDTIQSRRRSLPENYTAPATVTQ